MLKLSFLNVKGIPKLSWSSEKPLNFRPRLMTMFALVLGLSIFGLGEAVLIAAGAGVSPWSVLALGLSNVLGWTVGTSTFAVSVSVLVLWVPLRQIPGIGTILNAVIIAIMLDVAIPYLPKPEHEAAQVLQALAGVFITGFGGGIYLIANLGPGPRDGLMTGLQQLTNLPVAWVRSFIEICAVVAGWVLGGPVGVGTVLFAFLIGPAVAMSLYGLSKVFREPS